MGHPGHLAQRQLGLADVLADRVDLRADAARREPNRPDADPGEARGVVARRDRPRRRLRVELGQDRDVLRCATELVGDHLRAHRPVPLALGVVPRRTLIPPSGSIATDAPSALPDFGGCPARSTAVWASVM